MKVLCRDFLALLFCLLTGASLHASARQNQVDQDFFECGGSLEVKTWSLWDSNGKKLLDKLLEDRLVKQGDVYALYDFEIYFHNLLWMAGRCGRVDRQLELVKRIGRTYSQLTSIGSEKSSVGWICRGGEVCNKKNRLLDKEVMLASVQFLALATDAANNLPAGEAEKAAGDFVVETARIALAHLRRWNDKSSLVSLRRRISAQASDIKDSSSQLFFTDKDAWKIMIYANLAGIFSQRPQLRAELVASDAIASMTEHMTLLIELLRKRISFEKSKDASSQEFATADLDRGFWRLYPDNRYAAYENPFPPVQCSAMESAELGRTSFSIRVPTPRPVESLGWDLSHARRLVALFDTLEENQLFIESFFSIENELLPDKRTFIAFATQLRVRVWNQDPVHPLFKNYFGGANGWYRVAYDNGANRCTEGIPPFGLTAAFATGGYPAWGKWDKKIQELARQIYFLVESDKKDDLVFVDEAYPLFTRRASDEVRTRSELMFWPALVTRRSK